MSKVTRAIYQERRRIARITTDENGDSEAFPAYRLPPNYIWIQAPGHLPTMMRWIKEGLWPGNIDSVRRLIRSNLKRR